ncbi:auxin-induced protein 22C-like [Aristolochia californica]|uniref:auxin-induced protein 22C-like n=1 Tax=Aristolochia californica TaxID=171875 RepID=UPI0035DBC28D
MEKMTGQALGFEITELRLGLPGVGNSGGKKKRVFSEMTTAGHDAEDENSSSNERTDQTKNQVIGWPPVCSYRQKNNHALLEKKNAAEKMKFYVKVSMDGAPYLRKVDLGAYKGYSDLSAGLKELFGCFGIGSLTRDEQSEYSEYVTIYEDKEGDWMLVGDVPWEMFTDSCKRLRIMKRSEAKGFQLQLKSSPARLDQRIRQLG